jgi:hypothetical protein
MAGVEGHRFQPYWQVALPITKAAATPAAKGTPEFHHLQPTGAAAND